REATTSRFSIHHRKWNDIPLDWIRRLELDAGAPTPEDFPGTMLTDDEWAARREAVHPALAERLGKALDGESPTQLYLRILLRDDHSAGVPLAEALQAYTERKAALFLNTGFLHDSASAVANRALGPNAVYLEAAVATGALADDALRRLARLMLFFAHATREDALFPSHHNYLPPDHPHAVRNWAVEEHYSDLFGTANFQTDVYVNLGLFGAVFRRHPQAEEWMEEAADQMDDQLDFHFYPGGVYCESIGYFVHLFHNMLALASVLQRHGVRDFYADERFQAAMETLVDYLGSPRTPTPERRVGRSEPPVGPDDRMRFWPAIGDTGHNCAASPLAALIAHAGWEVRRCNRPLADKLLAAWNECGQPLWGHHFPQLEAVYIAGLDPDTPPLAGLLHTREFRNVGVLLRADVGTPRETCVFFRSGREQHHWGYEHGHVMLESRGALLIPEYGYHGETGVTDGEKVMGWNSWVHNIVTFGPDSNSGLAVERAGPEPLIRFGDAFDYAVADLRTNFVRHAFWRNIQPITPVEYYRHLVFARNRYLFVWDRIEFSVYPSQLRLNFLGDAMAQDGSRIHVTGHDGVDLHLHLAQPVAPALAEGQVGPMRYLLCEQDCERDYAWIAQPVGPDDRPVTVRSEPNHLTVGGIDEAGTPFTDHIVFAKGDHGAVVEIDGAPWRLDGRLAILRQTAAGQEIALADGTLAPDSA
ncbi:MAG: hypothetical protein ACOCX4_10075, partial [Planctomycetota bacterium]